MVVVFLWCLSFFLSLPLVQPDEIARLGAVACALLACAWPLARGMAGGGITLRQDAPLFCLIGFWGVAALSIMASSAPYISIIAFATLSLLPLSFLSFLCIPAAQRLAAFHTGAEIAAALLAGLALWALIQYIALPDRLVHGQVRMPFANANSYAALLAAGIVPSLAAALTAPVRGVRMAGGVLAALLVMAVTVIGGRAVLIALGAVVVLYLVVMRRQKNPARAGWLWLVAGMAAGALAAVLFAHTATAPLARMVHGVTGEAALFGRGPIWQAGWAMIRDHMWTGTGIGTFFSWYPAYRLPADHVSGGYMMHNDPLQFWAETGIAGMLLFYAFVIAACVRMYRRFLRIDVEHRPMAMALFCALGLLALHAHVDFDFYTAPILALCGMGLAWWYTLTELPEDKVTRVGLPATWAASISYATVFVPVIAILFVLQGLMLGELVIGRARTMAVLGQMEAFAADVNRGNHMSFGLNARAYMLAAMVPLGILEAPDHTLAADEKRALYDQISGLLDRAQAHDTRMVAVAYYRARLAALYRPDGTIGAEESLRTALKINPQHLPSRMMLADELQKQKRGDDAYDVLRDGLVWPYPVNDPREYYQLTMIRAMQHKDMETVARVKKLLDRVDRDRAPGLWPTPGFLPGASDDVIR